MYVSYSIFSDENICLNRYLLPCQITFLILYFHNRPASMNGKLSNSCSEIIRLKNLSEHRLTCDHISLINRRLNGSSVAYICTSQRVYIGRLNPCMNRRLFCPSHVIPSSSALKSSLRHPLCRPAPRYHRATNFVISDYVRQPRQTFPSLCAMRRAARFVRSLARSHARAFAFASLGVSSRWSVSSTLVAVVAVVVVSQRLIRLINETMPGPQIARAGSSRTKSEQCRYCSLTLAALQSDAPTRLYFEKFNGRSS